MYKETFVSPGGQPTKKDALIVLDKIREAHKDWIELDAYTEERPDGWHAVRVHQKPEN